MTVHAVKLVMNASPSAAKSNVPQKVRDEVLNDLDEVSPQQSQEISERNTENDGSGTSYLHGVRRVSGSHGKGRLDRFEQVLKGEVSWYRIKYHECDHDEENPSGCGGWQTEKEGGTVPSDV